MAVFMKAISFQRQLRTQSSEVFLLWSGKTRVARLSIHYGSSMYSDLIIEAEIDEKQYKRLVDLVYNFTGDI